MEGRCEFFRIIPVVCGAFQHRRGIPQCTHEPGRTVNSKGIFWSRRTPNIAQRIVHRSIIERYCEEISNEGIFCFSRIQFQESDFSFLLAERAVGVRLELHFSSLLQQVTDCLVLQLCFRNRKYPKNNKEMDLMIT